MTGARVKIGFYIALKLLRNGCRVLASAAWALKPRRPLWFGGAAAATGCCCCRLRVFVNSRRSPSKTSLGAARAGPSMLKRTAIKLAISASQLNSYSLCFWFALRSLLVRRRRRGSRTTRCSGTRRSPTLPSGRTGSRCAPYIGPSYRHFCLILRGFCGVFCEDYERICRGFIAGVAKLYREASLRGFRVARLHCSAYRLWVCAVWGQAHEAKAAPSNKIG